MVKKFLTPLKYSTDSLEPHFSKEAIKTHYEKHYKSYVNNFCDLIKNTSFEQQNLTIDQILQDIDADEMSLITDPVYNNAAQIKNHDLFFEQFNKNPQQLQNDDLKQLIKHKFESLKNLKSKLNLATTKHFGAGWVWLVFEHNVQWDAAPHLKITSTPNGGTFTNSATDNLFVFPLIVIDVWEHAFYIDYKSDRKQYFNNMWQVLDWSVIEQRFNNALQQTVDYTKPFEL